MNGVEDSKLKKTFAEVRSKQIPKLTNGVVLYTMIKSHVKREWLWRATTFPSRCKIIVGKILSGTLPTNINLNRGDNDQRKKLCRNCHKTAETDLHILNECPVTHNARSRRHDLVVKKLGKELKKVGYDVWLEKTYAVNLSRYKPDITAHRDGCCNIIEIMCPYEKFEGHLEQSEKRKDDKYELLSLENLNIEEEAGITTVKRTSLAFGSCGTIDKRTCDKVKQLGLKKGITKSIQMVVLMESSKIWSIHERHGKEGGK